MHTKKKPGSGESIDPDDAPELTKEMLDHAEWFHGDKFIKRGRGRPQTGNAKEQVSIRLDQEVLAKLRTAGPGWQTQANALLRGALGLDRPSEPSEGGKELSHASGAAELPYSETRHSRAASRDR